MFRSHLVYPDISAKKFSISAIPASNPFLFREYGLKIIKDYVPRSELTPFSGIDHTNNEDSEEDDTEDDEESEDFQREQQSQYEELMEKLRSDRVRVSIILSRHSIITFSSTKGVIWLIQFEMNRAIGTSNVSLV